MIVGPHTTHRLSARTKALGSPGVELAEAQPRANAYAATLRWIEEAKAHCADNGPTAVQNCIERAEEGATSILDPDHRSHVYRALAELFYERKFHRMALQYMEKADGVRSISESAAQENDKARQRMDL